MACHSVTLSFFQYNRGTIMKKTLFLTIALLTSGAALAETDHYLLREGNHVQHLKISKTAKDTKVTADVDFEPSAQEQGKRACSAEISGEAKLVNNELVLKKQVEGEAHYCTVSIQLTANGAKIKQSEECEYFATGLCHFSTGDQELVKIK
jgi:hypothetical protein